MVDLTSIFSSDKTLKLADDALYAAQFNEKPRAYLGASSIGENCSRKLWYRFRWLREVFDVETLKRFRDGHITEKTVIDQLKTIPNIKIHTHAINYVHDLGVYSQICFTDIDRHFSGHLDGEIEGIAEAPVTRHVLEIKAVSDKKFNELKKAKLELGEKLALRKWNPVYYAQIVLYMFYRKLTRSFHVVATSGARDWISIRTEADNKFAQTLIEKAKRIIYANNAPAQLPADSFDCKYCGYVNVCRNKELPPRQCRTCLHSGPIADGKWSCALFNKELSYEDQLAGCPNHTFMPSFVNGQVKEVNGNKITYVMHDGREWTDGK